MAALITATANGLDVHGEYIDLLRSEADALQASGVDYEEQDLRGPVSDLLISLDTTVLTTSDAELVKLLLAKLSDKAKTGQPQTVVNVQVNVDRFSLPGDEAAVGKAIDDLTQP